MNTYTSIGGARAIRTTTRALRESCIISNRVPFVAASMSGAPMCYDAGRMSGPECAAYLDASAAGTIDYVVRSYATPIAWFDRERGWVMPATRYSVTTSKHQSIVRAALRGEQVTA